MPYPYQRGWSRLSRHYVPVIPNVTLTNSYEGGSNGVTLTQGGGGNTGGVSGNPFDLIVIGAGCTLAFDTTRSAHGSSTGCQVATTGTATSVYGAWTTSAGTHGTLWFRSYLYYTATTVASRPVQARCGPVSAGSIAISTTGKLQLFDGAFGNQHTFTAAIPLGQWFRIEGYITGSPGSGIVSCSLYTSPDSVNAAESFTATGLNTTGAPNAVWFGETNSAANIGPWWQDDVGLSSAGPLGPSPGWAPFYPLNRPARAQVVNLRPGTVSHRAGTYGQTGAPLTPLQRPVGARIRVLPPPGHVIRRAGPYGGLGAAVRALASAVAGIVRGLPSRGRTAGRAGTYGQTGAPVKAAVRPVQARPGPQRGGTARGRAGTFTAAAPQTGPPVYPLGHPVQSRRPPLAPVRGRTVSQRGPAGQTGAPAVRLRRPAGCQPQTPVRTGRAAWRTGTWAVPPIAPPSVGALSAATAPAGTLTALTAASADSIYPITYTAVYLPGSSPVPGMTATDTPAGTLAAVTAASTAHDINVYATIYDAVYGIAPGGLLTPADTRTGGPG